MEYNINNENKVRIGDELSDDKNKYVVIDASYGNTHSQYADKVLVVCEKGPYKGREMWISHQLATEFKGEITCYS
jgi:hypothetical protein